MKKTLIFMAIGAVQTFVAHYLNLHKGLDHMQYGDEWGRYLFEGVFYALFWAGFYQWYKNQ